MGNINRHNVSIAMTTYNGGQYIEEQIKSLLNQTLLPDEIIVCDDGSNDNTIEILSKYQDGGILKFYQNSHTLGVIENFKKSVSLCKNGNYVVLADQDDYWMPNKIELQYAALESIDSPDVPCMVYSDLTLVNQNLEVLDSSFMRTLNIIPSRESLKSLIFGNFITGCTIMFNDSMKEHFLKMPKGAYMHDAWLGLIAFTFGRHHFIKEQLVKYRQHGGNVTFETNQSVSFFKKIKTNIHSLFAPNIFLESNIKLGKLFLGMYQNIISQEDAKLLESFCRLEASPFIFKKMKSFYSRRYRYINF